MQTKVTKITDARGRVVKNFFNHAAGAAFFDANAKKGWSMSLAEPPPVLVQHKLDADTGDEYVTCNYRLDALHGWSVDRNDMASFPVSRTREIQARDRTLGEWKFPFAVFDTLVWGMARQELVIQQKLLDVPKRRGRPKKNA